MDRPPNSPKELSRHLGNVAREARQKAGLTQQEAAERIGVATEVYGRMERGRMLPSLPTLLRVCRTLGLDANPLLGFSSSQPPAWLRPQEAPEEEAPAVRRLLRTLRHLKPHQLIALNSTANAMLALPATGASGEAKPPAQ
ncbi:helix-turn-helix domain-containing protein [Archangium sp.]|uniref:helix-turn-helix transcriptional regulator n=1 Tax=Archangium sp. TaxID=1872627 RepID=UPI00286A9F60|nr:helix-turn-helix domain-containing protein [Archangium sp.]